MTEIGTVVKCDNPYGIKIHDLVSAINIETMGQVKKCPRCGNKKKHIFGNWNECSWCGYWFKS